MREESAYYWFLFFLYFYAIVQMKNKKYHLNDLDNFLMKLYTLLFP